MKIFLLMMALCMNTFALGATLERLDKDWYIDTSSITFRITEDDNFQPIKNIASAHLYRSNKDLRSFMMIQTFCQMPAEKDIYIQYVENNGKLQVPYESQMYVDSKSMSFLTLFKEKTCSK